MFEPLREAILAGANTAEIKEESMRLGSKPCARQHLTKMAEGVTTLEEVLRTTIAIVKGRVYSVVGSVGKRQWNITGG